MTLFKKTLYNIFLILVLGIGQWAYAGSMEDSFMAEVRGDQSREVIRLIKQYIQDAPAEELGNRIQELARLDSLMSTLTKDGNDFVLGKLPRGTSLQMVPVELLYLHIKENGGPGMELRQFFQGRTFQYYPPAPEEQVEGLTSSRKMTAVAKNMGSTTPF